MSRPAREGPPDALAQTWLKRRRVFRRREQQSAVWRQAKDQTKVGQDCGRFREGAWVAEDDTGTDALSNVFLFHSGLRQRQLSCRAASALMESSSPHGVGRIEVMVGAFHELHDRPVSYFRERRSSSTSATSSCPTT